MKSESRDKILQVATQLFLKKSYHGTTTNEICMAAEINPPTLYYYFKSKRHLFFSCHMHSLDKHLKPYLKKAEAIKDASERLAFMIEEFTNMVCTNPALRVLIHETLSIEDE